jgi:single-strand DNA-binding protein
MSRSFNQVILMGNLTRDPELRATPNGQSVCSFSLALNRSYKDASGEWKEAVDYIDAVAWGPLGERVSQYVTKGRPVLVVGRLQSRAWEQDGQKRSKVEVLASDVTSKDGGAPSSGGGEYDQSQPTSKPTAKGKKKDDVIVDDISDEAIDLSDIPF